MAKKKRARRASSKRVPKKTPSQKRPPRKKHAKKAKTTSAAPKIAKKAKTQAKKVNKPTSREKAKRVKKSVQAKPPKKVSKGTNKPPAKKRQPTPKKPSQQIPVSSKVERYRSSAGKQVREKKTLGLTSTDGYVIDLILNGAFTDGQREAFQKAADRWTKVIRGGLPAVELENGEVVDGLLIDVRKFQLPSGQLGESVPTAFRPPTVAALPGLPATGNMHLSASELASRSQEDLEAMITHEMGHCLGFGTLWPRPFTNFIQSIGGRQVFTGKNAVREYENLLRRTGVESHVSGVPLEGGGIQGTASMHWSDGEFKNELMTGFLSPGFNPLSKVSVASLADLGYDVNLAMADDYKLPIGQALAQPSVTKLPHIHTVSIIKNPTFLSKKSLVKRR